jgi:small neutral amino acid transporter SnatA (MarC family)
MTTSNNNTATRNNENAKANIIAFVIMAVVLIIGLIYGMQLEAIGY